MHLTNRTLEILRDEGPKECARSVYQYGLRKAISDNQRLAINSYKNYVKNKSKYDAPAKPFQTIKINPRCVDHCYCGHPVKFKENGLGQVLGGGWDQEDELDLVSSFPVVKGLKERYEEGKAWEKTELIRYTEEKFERKNSVWGCDNIEEFIDRRGSYVDRIFEDITENGYCPESDQGEKNEKYPWRSRYKQELEPVVMIGREGDIIMRDGYHRFAIADILDIEIPVNVVRRHDQWQIKRDLVVNNTPPDHVCLTHPDLTELP